MEIGSNNWMKSINDGEKVNIIIRKTDRNKNGTPYLQACIASSAKFFMVNIGENQVENLDGVEYAVMSCTGHSPKGYPYLQFNAVDEFTMDQLDEYVPIDELFPEEEVAKEESRDLAVVESEEEQTYYPMDIEEDVLEILKNMQWMDANIDDDWYVNVKENLIQAMLVMYRRKIERIIRV